MKRELQVTISATTARVVLKQLLGMAYKKVYRAGLNANSQSSKRKR